MSIGSAWIVSIAISVYLRINFCSLHCYTACSCRVNFAQTYGVPDVTTFDGAALGLYTTGKFLMASSTEPFTGEHPCKFLVRYDEVVGQSADGNLGMNKLNPARVIARM